MTIKEILKTIFFSTETGEEKIKFGKGVLFFMLVCFVFVIPYDYSISVSELLTALAKNFLMVFVMFFIVLLLIFGAAKMLRSQIKFENFFSNVNFYLGISLILISVP